MGGQTKNGNLEQMLITKIKALSPQQVAEVVDFVEFLKLRDEEHSITQAGSTLSEESLHKVWDNADDADYDRL
jgi:hypothetical protein